MLSESHQVSVTVAGDIWCEQRRGLKAERECGFRRSEQKLGEEAIVDEELACYLAIIVTAERELEGQALP